MKKTYSLIIALILVVLLVFPVYANNPQPTGQQIRLFADPVSIQFPANEAFYIKHGFLTEAMGSENCQKIPATLPHQWGVADFKLELDGQFLREDYVEQYSEPCGGPTIHGRWWIFNFPDGMTGTHTFTGHWFMGCRAAVEAGYITGPCQGNGEQVEIITKSLTIEFVEP